MFWLFTRTNESNYVPSEMMGLESITSVLVDIRTWLDFPSHLNGSWKVNGRPLDGEGYTCMYVDSRFTN